MLNCHFGRKWFPSSSRWPTSEYDRPERGSPSASARLSSLAQTEAERWFARCPVAGVRPLRFPSRVHRRREGLGPFREAERVGQLHRSPTVACLKHPARLIAQTRQARPAQSIFQFLSILLCPKFCTLRGGQPRSHERSSSPDRQVSRVMRRWGRENQLEGCINLAGTKFSEP